MESSNTSDLITFFLMPHSNCLVSVIIPNYNHAPFLKKRIDSVVNQTYQDIEVILLDDCSSDESTLIMAEYKFHPKVKHVVLNEVNSGSPFKQWQKGFDLAKGAYIWIAESDDYADVDLLSSVMNVFQSNASAGLVFCDSNVVDAEGNIHNDFYKKYRNKNFNTNKWDRDYLVKGIEEIRSNLFFDCTINNMSAAVFKKELLLNVNFQQLLEFKYCGDWYFLIALVKQCDVAYISKPLNYFKYGTDNFKKGTKSALNYHKERLLVRYFFWKEMRVILSFTQMKNLSRQLSIELKIIINETVKGKNSVRSLLEVLKKLKDVNLFLLLKQMSQVCKLYVCKS